MGWQTDGRTGSAKIGKRLVVGFAMMRDPINRLIAFQPAAASKLDPTEPSPFDRAVIGEDAFEAGSGQSDPTIPTPTELPDGFWWVLRRGKGVAT